MKKLPLLIFAALLLAGMVSAARTRSPKNDISRNLEIFTAVYKNLQTGYVDSIDADKSVNTAIAAMLEEIDPYTEYIPESEQDMFMTISTGEYGGIGATVGTQDGRTFVTEPRDGTPSKKYGLLPGDVFLTINGDSVTRLPIDSVTRLLRGQAGTPLTVTVERPYGSSTLSDTVVTVNLVREKIEMDPVLYYGVERGDIGYIQINTFSAKTFPQTKEALENLLKDKRVKSIVLDLRNNGGGLLESAVQVLGLFLPKGTEAPPTRQRAGERTHLQDHRQADRTRHPSGRAGQRRLGVGGRNRHRRPPGPRPRRDRGRAFLWQGAGAVDRCHPL